MCVSTLPVCMHIYHAGACEGKKRTLDALGLGLQMVVSPCEGAGSGSL